MRIKPEDSICIIIDYQEKIVPVMANREELIQNSVQLLEGLHILDVPVILTTQYAKGLGLNISQITEAAHTEEYIDKITFSCYGAEEVKQAIAGKKNVILCGIEAHVCVLQTLIDLQEAGYQTVLVEDCISSRNLHDKEIALLRAQKEGGILTTGEALLFELTERAGSDTFKQISRLVK